MSNCIDPNYVELIARNAILKLLSDHTLQAGLRDCSCNWIGHETRVVTCDSLVDLVSDGIEEGDIPVPRLLSAVVNSEGELVLTFSDGSVVTIDLAQAIRDQIQNWANEQWPCGPLTEVIHDESLTGAGTTCDPLGVAAGTATAPPTTETDTLPTTMYGPRTALLGEPQGWISIGGVRVPHYGAV